MTTVDSPITFSATTIPENIAEMMRSL